MRPWLVQQSQIWKIQDLEFWSSCHFAQFWEDKQGNHLKIKTHLPAPRIGPWRVRFAPWIPAVWKNSYRNCSNFLQWFSEYLFFLLSALAFSAAGFYQGFITVFLLVLNIISWLLAEIVFPRFKYLQARTPIFKTWSECRSGPMPHPWLLDPCSNLPDMLGACLPQTQAWFTFFPVTMHKRRPQSLKAAMRRQVVRIPPAATDSNGICESNFASCISSHQLK